MTVRMISFTEKILEKINKICGAASHLRGSFFCRVQAQNDITELTVDVKLIILANVYTVRFCVAEKVGARAKVHINMFSIVVRADSLADDNGSVNNSIYLKPSIYFCRICICCEVFRFYRFRRLKCDKIGMKTSTTIER